MGGIVVFVVVLNVTALGHSATVLPDNPQAFASEAACRKAIPKVRRPDTIPDIATLDSVTCRRIEVAP